MANLVRLYYLHSDAYMDGIINAYYTKRATNYASRFVYVLIVSENLLKRQTATETAITIAAVL